MPEKFSDMRNSADSLESADSLIGNADSPSLEQLNYNAKQQEEKRKSHEKIDENDHQRADVDLENEISSLEISSENELNDFIEKHYPYNVPVLEFSQNYFEKQNLLGIKLSEEKLNQHILDFFGNENEISLEDQIKNYKKTLTKQGKSQTEILSLLISKFENEEAVSTWVENFRNFQRLHNFAESKPPKERKAIQNIISSADFSSATSFETSLSQISQSSEISAETKFEISREFGGHIDSVDGMDYQLKEIKSYKKQIEQEIKSQSSKKESLDSEIESLENEIDKLPLDDPKRQELEEKLEKKAKILDKTKKEIDRLEKGKPKDISFRLREGISAKLNKDGSRSVKIDLADFAIKLPTNRLPFTGTKNLRAINVAFPYLVLKNLHIANLIFRPNLENNTIPSKSQRDMGHLILSSLGIDDKRILSEEKIKQLKKDLAFLSPKTGKTGKENLIELGIFDIDFRSVNENRLKEVLEVVKENQGLRDKIFQIKNFK